MTRIGRVVPLAIVAFCAAPRARIQAQAELTANRVQVGEPFSIQVQAQTDGEAKVIPAPDVTLPAGVRLLGKQRSEGVSESVQIINFKMTRTRLTTIQTRIDLVADKPGTYAIGPVTLNLPGEKKNLGTAQVVVEKNGANGGSGPSATSASSSSGVEIATLITPREAWVGQQLSFNWRLAANRPFQIKRFPDVRSALGNGFWTAMPDTQPRMIISQAPNGQQSGRLDVTGALFALKPGTPRLPSIRLDYQIVEQSPGMDPFEAMLRGLDPFQATQGRTWVVDKSTRTSEVPLRIRELPAEGRPASFQGGVGTFRLEARLEKNQVRVGEGTTLLVVLEGNGQPQASGLPLWNPPAGVDVAPPEDRWTSQWKNGELWTRLERRYVLVPSNAGRQELSPVTFSFFDPAKSRYQPLSVALPALENLPRATNGASAATVANGPALRSSDRIWILVGKASAVLWALVVLGFAGWGLWRTLRAHRDPKTRKVRRLARIAKGIDVAERLPHPGKWIALRKILDEALACALGEDVRGRTLLELCQQLEASGWNETRIQELSELWKTLDASAYAGIVTEQPLPAQLRRLLNELATS